MQMQMTSADRGGMIMTLEKMLGAVVAKEGGLKPGKQETTQMRRFVDQVSLDKQETTQMKRFVEQVLDHTSCKSGEFVDYKSDLKECNRGGRENGKKSPNGNAPEVERVKNCDNCTQDSMQFPRPIQVNIIVSNLEPKLGSKLTECEVVEWQDLISKEECTGKDPEELPYPTGKEGAKNYENFTHSQGSHSVMTSD